MADKIDRGIGDELRRITHMGSQTRFPVMMGKVVAGSVDEGALTCSVVLNVDDAGVETPGVLLNSVQGNGNSFLLFPADNSFVWVAEVNGPGILGIIKCSDVYKIRATAGTLIQLNDGSLGGLTKTQELRTQVDKLNTLVAHLVATINGTVITEPGSGAASALQAALQAAITGDTVGDFSNIENTKITHG